MPFYRISYLVTTYNKLPYLKEVMTRLVATRRTDEEIVVADGGSTDGTTQYLQELYSQGLIQQFVSGRDKGEAHGFNKCVFMAKGDLIKLISDDDAFNYPLIRQVADFMIAHPAVDVVAGYNATIQEEDLTYSRIKEDPAVDFMRWFKSKEPFWMIGLPLVIRRSSLPLLGLFHTGLVFVDLEFTYRISAIQANIAWCTALLSMHVDNSHGNFLRLAAEKREAEYARVRNFFIIPKRRSPLQLVRALVEGTKRPIRPAKRRFFDQMGWRQIQNPEVKATGYVPRPGENRIAAMYRVCDEFMVTQSQLRKTEFIFKAEMLEKVMS